ncbi:MAG: ATP-binding protein, partial [Actinomycetota bacterium]|nr:ATP-binding protein [Actinomycetota bacterium]
MSADDRPGDAEGEQTGKTSAATTLVQLAAGRYVLGMSTDDEPYALPITGPRVARLLRGGKGSLRAEMAAAYFADTGRVAPQQALADALLVLEGMAASADPEPLHLRVAQQEGALWLDLGDGTGQAVRITPGGWRVSDDCPVLFRRTALTGPLPEPERGGELGELWHLLNVAERDRSLVLAWLVAALFPSLPHPVLAFRGEQGTAKSTTTRTTAGLLDPSPAPIRKPPRDADSWVTAAAGSWIVGVDNVSTIPEWWSDSLCRAVTGDGDVRRQLYTDGDLVVFAFRRAIILNGVDLGAVRDDLADRLLTVDLERIGDAQRRLDDEIAQAWREAHPRILGALLDLASGVLAALPNVRLERLPRMADFARILAAVDAVLGTDGLTTYLGQAVELAADAVTGDPVLAALTAAVTGEWVGTAAELLAELELLARDEPASRRPRDWPKDPRALTGLLARRAPLLRRVGWTVEHLGRGGKAMTVRWRLAPPNREPRQAAVGQASAGVRQAS